MENKGVVPMSYTHLLYTQVTFAKSLFRSISLPTCSMAESELLVAVVCGVLLTVVVEVFVVLMWIYSKPQEPVAPRGQFSPYVPAHSPPVCVGNVQSLILLSRFLSGCIKKLQHSTKRIT